MSGQQIVMRVYVCRVAGVRVRKVVVFDYCMTRRGGGGGGRKNVVQYIVRMRHKRGLSL